MESRATLDAMPRVLLVLLVIALTVYAVVEAAQAQPSRVRLMPKWLWITAIIVLPVLGPLAWFVRGRPRGRGLPDGPRRRPISPDDDPDFLRRL